ncbi:MAG: hypothetical protein AAEJ46_08460, partial [Planctomycetota bacterium]
MNRTTPWIVSALCSLLMGCGASPDRDANADTKPNIVYIMADELGYYELSVMGHPHFNTPHIDQLA